MLDALALGLRGSLLGDIDPRGEAGAFAVGIGFSIGVVAPFVVPGYGLRQR